MKKDEFSTDLFFILLFIFTGLTLAPLHRQKNGLLIDKNVNHINNSVHSFMAIIIIFNPPILLYVFLST